MSRVVFDIEADGLLLEATKIWCIAAIDIDKGLDYFWPPEIIEDAIRTLNKADLLIGHNIVGYDIPLIWKLYGIGLKPPTCDTQILSYLYNPDRGGHSVEWWAEYLGGEKKVQHEDWDNFSTDMMKRCISDVRLTEKIYYVLMQEREM